MNVKYTQLAQKALSFQNFLHIRCLYKFLIHFHIKYIEISSWEVVRYGIYARVNLFSENERASATSE